MADRAQTVANLLLQVGVLDDRNPDHRDVYEELMANPLLYEEVSKRLNTVGFEVVQFFGHLGMRLCRQAELQQETELRNTLGLHAGHIRLLVYLWVQLVYRQIKAASRDEDVEPIPGREQTMLGFQELEDGDDEPSIPWEEIRAEFTEEYSSSTLKGLITTLKRHGFARQAGATGPVSVGPALYVLVDPLRMEEFVVGLARRGAGPLAGEREG